jgi:hypothetical protein
MRPIAGRGGKKPALRTGLRLTNRDTAYLDLGVELAAL